MGCPKFNNIKKDEFLDKKDDEFLD